MPEGPTPPTPPPDAMPAGRLALRLLWIAARIAACASLGHSGAEFFYQGF
jgi:hypothetical protein